MDVQQTAIIVRRSSDVGEALRSAIGLGLENIFSTVMIIDTDLPSINEAGELPEWLEMIDDLEGTVYSNVPASTQAYPSIRFMDLEGLAEKINRYDLILNM
ncbi:MAG: hypothetical protein HQK55_15805 [Deltaproteobacteria bacterium]|nr:hypothetical protein [Deltaproteobacteria bacterium]